MKNNLVKVNLSKYINRIGLKNQFARMIWIVAWTIFIKPLPRNIGSGWIRFLLCLFGAKIHKTANVYSGVRIYMPWNLEMGEYSCMAPEVDCYNVSKIKIGANVTVSQKTYLCAASHDITSSYFPLITSPIIIEDQAWIGASSYIGMGVRIGEGAVVGATASVYRNVESWTVVGGNPARVLKKRVLNG